MMIFILLIREYQFHSFKDLTASSITKYKGLLVEFVLYLIAPDSHQYLPCDIRDLVEDYIYHYTAEAPSDAPLDSDDPILDKLHELLFECISFGTDADFDPLTNIPMYRFLVHHVIDKDGVYSSLETMTQTIAKLQYITRGVLLIEARKSWRYSILHC